MPEGFKLRDSPSHFRPPILHQQQRNRQSSWASKSGTVADGAPGANGRIVWVQWKLTELGKKLMEPWKHLRRMGFCNLFGVPVVLQPLNLCIDHQLTGHPCPATRAGTPWPGTNAHPCGHHHDSQNLLTCNLGWFLFQKMRFNFDTKKMGIDTFNNGVNYLSW